MKTHTQKKVHSPKRERGQSLVEMALILPFLLILVIGIVEAGLALNRQLTVVNAAREGARFGAFGAAPDDIHAQTLLATSKMFEFTEENAVVAVIHAETNYAGDGFEEWTENIYPADATVPHVTQGEVLAELQAEGDAASLRLVVVDVRYDHESMLGLPFVGALADQIPINSWTVMRLTVHKEGNPSCCPYPIALPLSELEGKKAKPDKPVWLEDLWSGSGEGNFGWLRWVIAPSGGSEPYLASSLQLDSENCHDYQNPGEPEDFTPIPGDHNVVAGKWICGDTGVSNSDDIKDALYVFSGINDPGDPSDDNPPHRIQVIVWDDAEGTGSNAHYRIAGFAIIEITCEDYNSKYTVPDDSHCKSDDANVCGGEPFCLKSSDNRISGWFFGMDEECQ